MRPALAGGCSSPVRSGWAVGGAAFVQTRGSGAYAFDDRGERFVDYIMAYGPLLFGHSHPSLIRDLERLGAEGFVFGSTHPEEERLAARIRAHLPSMQTLRFVTTGSEAVMSAVRVARAYTGRSLILRFAGNYHGHFDLALLDAGASAHTRDASRAGIPGSVANDVVVARYNDLSSVDEKLAGRESELAAILVEPIAANMGFITPVLGFLEGLQERARRFGALLVFDEIITWLRLGLGGAQARTGICADLTTVGKVLGGGAPIAAFGGRAEIMRVLAPEGATFTGGTHAGNPFCVGMAHRVLDMLEEHAEYYAQLDELGGRLARGLRETLARRSLPYAVVQHGSIVDFKFRAGSPVRNYEDACAADADRYAAYYHAMRARNILLPPSQNEVMFVSTAHVTADIDRTVEAADASLTELSR